VYAEDERVCSSEHKGSNGRSSPKRRSRVQQPRPMDPRRMAARWFNRAFVDDSQTSRPIPTSSMKSGPASKAHRRALQDHRLPPPPSRQALVQGAGRMNDLSDCGAPAEAQP